MDKSIITQIHGIKPDDLILNFKELIRTEISEFKKLLKLKESEEYLTRKEVAKMLKIDLSSVHNWTKKGKLKSHGLGGRVYYKKSEIENAFVKLND
ncbi:helix-turn-helix domain-containing protein [Winogradskyella sp.]|uniref:helix-turn-helix domain-containing protein n=1 Tax=Winogradskyella sp. TaxID=1883156 RepID=UPI00260A9AE7|nr:helix-turn-helix domain-containing protein [Winogradskyella sp.]